jgi:glycosyltransferase involved in cell wall biosynthesis
MLSTPVLSIVTPTRGNFSEYWLERLLAVEGDVQFVLVYPPGAIPRAISDPRFTSIVSPYKGEVVQRLTGLANAVGTYVIALDDDDFVHPDIVNLVKVYFETFPESWVLRPRSEKIDFKNTDKIQRPWEPIPDVHTLAIASRQNGQEAVLQTIPIAPLENSLDIRYFFSPFLNRRDMHGPHIENFNNKVWRTELVRTSVVELSTTMKIVGVLNWMPFWNLDRLLGLFVQAMFFKPDTVVGHWMPHPPQVRYIVTPQFVRQEFRLMLPADALLVKRFPRYGYFWNLFFDQFWIAVRKLMRSAIDLDKFIKKLDDSRRGTGS